MFTFRNTSWFRIRRCIAAFLAVTLVTDPAYAQLAGVAPMHVFGRLFNMVSVGAYSADTWDSYYSGSGKDTNSFDSTYYRSSGQYSATDYSNGYTTQTVTGSAGSDVFRFDSMNTPTSASINPAAYAQTGYDITKTFDASGSLASITSSSPTLNVLFETPTVQADMRSFTGYETAAGKLLINTNANDGAPGFTGMAYHSQDTQWNFGGVDRQITNSLIQNVDFTNGRLETLAHDPSQMAALNAKAAFLNEEKNAETGRHDGENEKGEQTGQLPYYVENSSDENIWRAYTKDQGQGFMVRSTGVEMRIGDTVMTERNKSFTGLGASQAGREAVYGGFGSLPVNAQREGSGEGKFQVTDNGNIFYAAQGGQGLISNIGSEQNGLKIGNNTFFADSKNLVMQAVNGKFTESAGFSNKVAISGEGTFTQKYGEAALTTSFDKQTALFKGTAGGGFESTAFLKGTYSFAKDGKTDSARIDSKADISYTNLGIGYNPKLQRGVLSEDGADKSMLGADREEGKGAVTRNATMPDQGRSLTIMGALTDGDKPAYEVMGEQKHYAFFNGAGDLSRVDYVTGQQQEGVKLKIGDGALGKDGTFNWGGQKMRAIGDNSDLYLKDGSMAVAQKGFMDGAQLSEKEKSMLAQAYDGKDGHGSIVRGNNSMEVMFGAGGKIAAGNFRTINDLAGASIKEGTKEDAKEVVRFDSGELHDVTYSGDMSNVAFGKVTKENAAQTYQAKDWFSSSGKGTAVNGFMADGKTEHRANFSDILAAGRYTGTDAKSMKLDFAGALKVDATTDNMAQVFAQKAGGTDDTPKPTYFGMEGGPLTANLNRSVQDGLNSRNLADKGSVAFMMNDFAYNAATKQGTVSSLDTSTLNFNGRNVQWTGVAQDVGGKDAANINGSLDKMLITSVSRQDAKSGFDDKGNLWSAPALTKFTYAAAQGDVLKIGQNETLLNVNVLDQAKTFKTTNFDAASRASLKGEGIDLKDTSYTVKNWVDSVSRRDASKGFDTAFDKNELKASSAVFGSDLSKNFEMQWAKSGATGATLESGSVQQIGLEKLQGKNAGFAQVWGLGDGMLQSNVKEIAQSMDVTQPTQKNAAGIPVFERMQTMTVRNGSVDANTFKTDKGFTTIGFDDNGAISFNTITQAANLKYENTWLREGDKVGLGKGGKDDVGNNAIMWTLSEKQLGKDKNGKDVSLFDVGYVGGRQTKANPDGGFGFDKKGNLAAGTGLLTERIRTEKASATIAANANAKDLIVAQGQGERMSVEVSADKLLSYAEYGKKGQPAAPEGYIFFDKKSLNDFGVTEKDGGFRRQAGQRTIDGETMGLFENLSVVAPGMQDVKKPKPSIITTDTDTGDGSVAVDKKTALNTLKVKDVDGAVMKIDGLTQANIGFGENGALNFQYALKDQYLQNESSFGAGSTKFGQKKSLPLAYSEAVSEDGSIKLETLTVLDGRDKIVSNERVHNDAKSFLKNLTSGDVSMTERNTATLDNSHTVYFDKKGSMHGYSEGGKTSLFGQDFLSLKTQTTAKAVDVTQKDVGTLKAYEKADGRSDAMADIYQNQVGYSTGATQPSTVAGQLADEAKKERASIMAGGMNGMDVIDRGKQTITTEITAKDGKPIRALFRDDNALNAGDSSVSAMKKQFFAVDNADVSFTQSVKRDGTAKSGQAVVITTTVKDDNAFLEATDGELRLKTKKAINVDDNGTDGTDSRVTGEYAKSTYVDTKAQANRLYADNVTELTAVGGKQNNLEFAVNLDATSSGDAMKPLFFANGSAITTAIGPNNSIVLNGKAYGTDGGKATLTLKDGSSVTLALPEGSSSVTYHQAQMSKDNDHVVHFWRKREEAGEDGKGTVNKSSYFYLQGQKDLTDKSKGYAVTGVAKQENVATNGAVLTDQNRYIQVTALNGDRQFIYDMQAQRDLGGGTTDVQTFGNGQLSRSVQVGKNGQPTLEYELRVKKQSAPALGPVKSMGEPAGIVEKALKGIPGVDASGDEVYTVGGLVSYEKGALVQATGADGSKKVFFIDISAKEKAAKTTAYATDTDLIEVNDATFKNDSRIRNTIRDFAASQTVDLNELKKMGVFKDDSTSYEWTDASLFAEGEYRDREGTTTGGSGSKRLEDMGLSVNDQGEVKGVNTFLNAQKFTEKLESGKLGEAELAYKKAMFDFAGDAKNTEKIFSHFKSTGQMFTGVVDDATRVGDGIAAGGVAVSIAALPFSGGASGGSLVVSLGYLTASTALSIVGAEMVAVGLNKKDITWGEAATTVTFAVAAPLALAKAGKVLQEGTTLIKGFNGVSALSKEGSFAASFMKTAILPSEAMLTATKSVSTFGKAIGSSLMTSQGMFVLQNSASMAFNGRAMTVSEGATSYATSIAFAGGMSLIGRSAQVFKAAEETGKLTMAARVGNSVVSGVGTAGVATAGTKVWNVMVNNESWSSGWGDKYAAQFLTSAVAFSGAQFASSFKVAEIAKDAGMWTKIGNGVLSGVQSAASNAAMFAAQDIVVKNATDPLMNGKGFGGALWENTKAAGHGALTGAVFGAAFSAAGGIAQGLKGRFASSAEVASAEKAVSAWQKAGTLTVNAAKGAAAGVAVGYGFQTAMNLAQTHTLFGQTMDKNGNMIDNTASDFFSWETTGKFAALGAAGGMLAGSNNKFAQWMKGDRNFAEKSAAEVGFFKKAANAVASNGAFNTFVRGALAGTAAGVGNFAIDLATDKYDWSKQDAGKITASFLEGAVYGIMTNAMAGQFTKHMKQAGDTLAEYNSTAATATKGFGGALSFGERTGAQKLYLESLEGAIKWPLVSAGMETMAPAFQYVSDKVTNVAFFAAGVDTRLDAEGRFGASYDRMFGGDNWRSTMNNWLISSQHGRVLSPVIKTITYSGKVSDRAETATDDVINSRIKNATSKGRVSEVIGKINPVSKVQARLGSVSQGAAEYSAKTRVAAALGNEVLGLAGVSAMVTGTEALLQTVNASALVVDARMGNLSDRQKEALSEDYMGFMKDNYTSKGVGFSDEERGHLGWAVLSVKGHTEMDSGVESLGSREEQIEALRQIDVNGGQSGYLSAYHSAVDKTVEVLKNNNHGDLAKKLESNRDITAVKIELESKGSMSGAESAAIEKAYSLRNAENVVVSSMATGAVSFASKAEAQKVLAVGENAKMVTVHLADRMGKAREMALSRHALERSATPEGVSAKTMAAEYMLRESSGAQRQAYVQEWSKDQTTAQGQVAREYTTRAEKIEENTKRLGDLRKTKSETPADDVLRAAQQKALFAETQVLKAQHDFAGAPTVEKFAKVQKQAEASLAEKIFDVHMKGGAVEVVDGMVKSKADVAPQAGEGKATRTVFGMDATFVENNKALFSDVFKKGEVTGHDLLNGKVGIEQTLQNAVMERLAVRENGTEGFSKNREALVTGKKHVDELDNLGGADRLDAWFKEGCAAKPIVEKYVKMGLTKEHAVKVAERQVSEIINEVRLPELLERNGWKPANKEARDAILGAKGTEEIAVKMKDRDGIERTYRMAVGSKEFNRVRDAVFAQTASEIGFKKALGKVGSEEWSKELNTAREKSSGAVRILENRIRIREKGSSSSLSEIEKAELSVMKAKLALMKSELSHASLPVRESLRTAWEESSGPLARAKFKEALTNKEGGAEGFIEKLGFGTKEQIQAHEAVFGRVIERLVANKERVVDAMTSDSFKNLSSLKDIEIKAIKNELTKEISPQLYDKMSDKKRNELISLSDVISDKKSELKASTDNKQSESIQNEITAKENELRKIADDLSKELNVGAEFLAEVMPEISTALKKQRDATADAVNFEIIGQILRVVTLTGKNEGKGENRLEKIEVVDAATYASEMAKPEKDRTIKTSIVSETTKAEVHENLKTLLKEKAKIEGNPLKEQSIDTMVDATINKFVDTFNSTRETKSGSEYKMLTRTISEAIGEVKPTAPKAPEKKMPTDFKTQAEYDQYLAKDYPKAESAYKAEQAEYKKKLDVYNEKVKENAGKIKEAEDVDLAQIKTLVKEKLDRNVDAVDRMASALRLGIDFVQAEFGKTNYDRTNPQLQMLSGFLREKNVQLRAGGGKTIAFSLEMLVRDAGATNVQNQLLVAKTGEAYQTAMAGYEAVGGKGEVRLDFMARMFGKEIVDGKALKESGVENLAKALEDRNKIVVMDQESLGFSTLEESVALRKAYGNLDTVRWDEFHMPFSAPTSYISSKDANKAIDRTYIDQAIEVRKVMQELEAGGKLKDATVGLREGEIATDRVKESNDRKDGDGEALYIIDRKTNKYVYSDSFVELVKEKIGNRVNFNSKNDMMEAVNQYFQAEKLMDANSYSIHDGRIVPVGAGNLEVSRVFSSKEQIAALFAKEAAKGKLNVEADAAKQTVSTTGSSGSVAEVMRMINPAASNLGASGTIDTVELMVKMNIGKGVERASESVYDVSKTLGLQAEAGKTYVQQVIEQVVATIDAASEAGRGAIVLAKDQIMLDTIMSDPSVKKALERADKKGLKKAEIGIRSGEKDVGDIAANAKNHVIFANEKGATGIDYKGNIDLVLCDAHNWNISEIKQGIARNRRQEGTVGERAVLFDKSQMRMEERADGVVSKVMTKPRVDHIDSIIKEKVDAHTSHIERVAKGKEVSPETTRDKDDALALLRNAETLMAEDASAAIIFQTREAARSRGLIEPLKEMLRDPSLSASQKDAVQKIYEEVLNDNTGGSEMFVAHDAARGDQLMKQTVESVARQAADVFKRIADDPAKFGSSMAKRAEVYRTIAEDVATNYGTFVASSTAEGGYNSANSLRDVAKLSKSKELLDKIIIDDFSRTQTDRAVAQKTEALLVQQNSKTVRAEIADRAAEISRKNPKMDKNDAHQQAAQEVHAKQYELQHKVELCRQRVEVSNGSDGAAVAAYLNAMANALPQDSKLKEVLIGKDVGNGRSLLSIAEGYFSKGKEGGIATDARFMNVVMNLIEKNRSVTNVVGNTQQQKNKSFEDLEQEQSVAEFLLKAVAPNLTYASAHAGIVAYRNMPMAVKTELQKNPELMQEFLAKAPYVLAAITHDPANSADAYGLENASRHLSFSMLSFIEGQRDVLKGATFFDPLKAVGKAVALPSKQNADDMYGFEFAAMVDPDLDVLRYRALPKIRARLEQYIDLSKKFDRAELQTKKNDALIKVYQEEIKNKKRELRDAEDAAAKERITREIEQYEREVKRIGERKALAVNVVTKAKAGSAEVLGGLRTFKDAASFLRLAGKAQEHIDVNKIADMMDSDTFSEDMSQHLTKLNVPERELMMTMIDAVDPAAVSMFDKQKYADIAHVKNLIATDGAAQKSRFVRYDKEYVGDLAQKVVTAIAAVSGKSTLATINRALEKAYARSSYDDEEKAKIKKMTLRANGVEDESLLDDVEKLDAHLKQNVLRSFGLDALTPAASADDIKNALSFDALKKRVESLDGGASHETVMRTMMPYYQWEIERKIRKSAADKVKSMFGPSTDAYISQLKEAVKHAAMNKNSLAEQTGILARYDVAGVLKGRTTTLNEKEIDALLANKDLTVERMFVQSVEVVPPGALVNSETGKSVAAQVTADGVVKLDVGFLKFVTTKQSVGGEKKEVDRLVFDAATEYNFGEGAHELVHQFVKSFGTFIANDVGTSKPQQYEELKRLLSGTRDGRMYVRMIEETASIAAKNPWEIEYRINEMEENEMVVRGVSLVQTIEAMSRSSRMQHLDENMNAKYGAKSGAFFAHPEAALDMKGRSTDEIVRTAGGLSHEAIIRRMYTDEAVRRNWLVKASDPSVVRYNKQAAKDLRSVTDYLRSAPNAVELYFNGTKDQQSMQKVINNIFRENVRATAYDQDLLEKYNDLQKSTNQVDQKERLAQYLAALDRFGRALDSGTNRRVEHSDDGMPASVTIKNIGGTGRTGVGAGEGAGDADGAGKDFQNVSPETVMAYIGSIEALEAMATQVSQEADEKRGELLRKILAGMTENAVMETKDLRKMGDYVLAYEKSADMNAFARFVATAKNNLVATKEKAFVAMQQRLMKEQQKYADELTWLQNEQQQMQQKEQDLENQKPLIIVAAQNAAADIEARKAELAAVRAAYAGMTADDVAAVKQQLVAADVFPAELTSSIDRALGLGMKETAWTVLASEDAKALIDAAFTKKEAAIDAQGNASVQEAAKIDKRIAETQSRMAKNAEETTLAQASLTRAQEELKQLLESRKSDETKPSAAGSAVTASSAVELDPTRMTLSDLEQLLSDKVTKFGRLIGEIDAARAGYRNAGREVRLDKLAAISKAIDEFKVGAFRANEIIQVLAGSPMDEEHGDVRTNDDVLVNTIARSIVYGDTRELHLKRFDTANALSGFVLNDLLLDEQKGDASQRDLDQESEFNRLVMKSLREYQKRIANALVAVEAYSAVVDSLAIPQNATADDRSKAIEGFAFVIDQKGNRGEGSEERKYVNIPMMLKAYAEQTVREQFGSVDVLKEQDKDFSKSLSSISDMIATSTEQKGKGADVTTSVKAAVSQIVIARAVRRTVLTSVMQRNDKVAGTDRYLDLSNRSTRLALRKVMKTLVGDKGSLVDIKSLTKKTDVTQLMAQMHSEVVEQAKRFEEVDAAKEEALKKDVKESAVKVLLALGEGDLAKAAKNVGSCVRSFSQIVEINGLYFEMDWFIHYSFLATFAANKGEEPAKAVADDATKTAITLAQPLMQANPYVTFAQGSAAAGMPMYQTTMKVAEQSARVAMPMYQAMVAASQRSSAAMLPMSKAVTKSAMITAIPLMSAFDKYAEYHPSVLKKAVDDNAPIDQDAITLAPELKDWANAAEALALESIKAKQLARNGEVPQELVSKIKIVLDAKAREYVNKTGETVPLEAMEYVRANVYKKLRGENVATQSESIAQASMAAVTIKSIATLKRALDGKQTLPITEFTAQSATGPLSGVLGVIGLVNRFGGRKAPEKAPPPTKAQVGPMGAATPKKEFELASAG